MAWDIKYRPLRFSDVLGQSGTVSVLKSRLLKGTALDTSYIFSGGPGQGKTTLARILARAILCQNLESDGEPCNTCDNCQGILVESSAAFSEMDAASKGTIDNVRSIVDSLPYVVQNAPKKIYLFDEAHRMSRDAQDVLLKPVEDKKLVGIFCTTEPEKIRGAIRSRCEEYSIRKITREDILGRMKLVLEQEGVGYEDDAILTVIDHSGRHVRDILNKLEMVAQLGPVSLSQVREYLQLSVVSIYYGILLNLGDPSKSVPLVEAACDRVGVDEVSAGLAEAAMNSFRLAKGVFTDSVYLDREQAVKVYAQYGDLTIQLAEFFLSSKRHGPSALICDVISCASGVPSRNKSDSESRVVVQAIAYDSPNLAPSQVCTEPPAVKESDTPTVVNPIETRPSQIPPKQPVKEYSYTSLDKDVRGEAMPKGAHKDDSIKTLTPCKPNEEFITVDGFRKIMKSLWRGS